MGEKIRVDGPYHGVSACNEVCGVTSTSEGRSALRMGQREMESVLEVLAKRMAEQRSDKVMTAEVVHCALIEIGKRVEPLGIVLDSDVKDAIQDEIDDEQAEDCEDWDDDCYADGGEGEEDCDCNCSPLWSAYCCFSSEPSTLVVKNSR